jgi:hypothetical protein
VVENPLTAPIQIVCQSTRGDGGDIESDQELAARGTFALGKAGVGRLGRRGEPRSAFVAEHRQPVDQQRVTDEVHLLA